MSTQYRWSKEQAYFAASNSRMGFHSYYESRFRSRVDRLYCIKGGPGTGKSTLMRRLAHEGERRGYRVEYYYCSSDANSLDAVLLFGENDSLGVLDATPPHAFEPSLPGVAEEIWDLGQFWNADQLIAHRATIVHLNTEKAQGYRRAYHYLAGAGEVADVLRDSIAPCVDAAKLARTVKRLLKGTRAGTHEGRQHIALSDSIGMSGRVRLDTYLRLGERVCLIEDYGDTAYMLTHALLEAASGRGANVQVSYHPVLPDRIDALLLEDDKTVFVVCGAEDADKLSLHVPHARHISMRRMLLPAALRGVREEVRRACRLRASLMDAAQAALQGVSRAHFELERLYGAAMDFEAKERYTDALCRRLFSDFDARHTGV